MIYTGQCSKYPYNKLVIALLSELESLLLQIQQPMPLICIFKTVNKHLVVLKRNSMKNEYVNKNLQDSKFQNSFTKCLMRCIIRQ